MTKKGFSQLVLQLECTKNEASWARGDSVLWVNTHDPASSAGGKVVPQAWSSSKLNPESRNFLGIPLELNFGVIGNRQKNWVCGDCGQLDL